MKQNIFGNVGEVLLCCCMLPALNACVSEELPQGEVEHDGEPTLVTFVPCAYNPDTRSVYAPAESCVSDVNLFVYHDGSLAEAVYSESALEVEMSLVAGEDYTLLAVANVGEVQNPPADIAGIYDMEIPLDYSVLEEKGIPMSAIIGDIHISPAGQTVPVNLVRLLAKYGFRVGMSAVSDAVYNFTKVSLMQAASSLRPFSSQVAASLSDVSAGDTSSTADIDKVNAGEEVFFYVPENMQGTLLEGNSDPWNKVPDSIGDKKDLCTYIQADAEYSAQGASGDVSFRFYLGTDDCSNFDVCRNNYYHIVLYPGDDSPYAVSWKMDADVEWDDSICSLTEPQHIGSWGRLNVPGASSVRQYTVRMSSAGSVTDIVLGGSEPSTVQCGAYTCCYNPSDPENLHYMPSAMLAGTEPSASLPRFTVSRGNVSISVNASVHPDIPMFLFDDGIVTNEDGYGEVSNLQMDTPMDAFMTPAAVMSLLPSVMSGVERKWHYFKSTFYDRLRLSVADTFSEGDNPLLADGQTDYSCAKDVTRQQYASVYDAWEDGVLAVVGLYGLKAKDNAATAQVFIPFYEDTDELGGTCVTGHFGYVVEPAFPEWRYIGEYENVQFSPSAPSLVTPISFVGSNGTSIPTPHAVWDVRHGKFDIHDMGDRLEKVWNSGRIDGYSKDIQMSADRLSFPEAPVSGLCCGPMVCRGQVTNPVSGRVISGYYTLDLVMRLSVGVRISADGHETSYCFTPFTKYASQEYYDLWEEFFPKVHVEHMFMKSENNVQTQYWSYVEAQQYPDSQPSLWPLKLYHIGREVYNDSEMEELVDLCNDLAGNYWFDFNFYDKGSTFISKQLKLDEGTLYLIRGCNVFTNTSSEYYKYADGSQGYYILTKQYKIGDVPDTDYCEGLQNYVLEAALSNFTDY